MNPVEVGLAAELGFITMAPPGKGPQSKWHVTEKGLNYLEEVFYGIIM